MRLGLGRIGEPLPGEPPRLDGQDLPTFLRLPDGPPERLGAETITLEPRRRTTLVALILITLAVVPFAAWFLFLR